MLKKLKHSFQEREGGREGGEGRRGRKEGGREEFELVSLANICPENAEEALIPR